MEGNTKRVDGRKHKTCVHTSCDNRSCLMEVTLVIWVSSVTEQSKHSLYCHSSDDVIIFQREMLNSKCVCGSCHTPRMKESMRIVCNCLLSSTVLPQSILQNPDSYRYKSCIWTSTQHSKYATFPWTKGDYFDSFSYYDALYVHLEHHCCVSPNLEQHWCVYPNISRLPWCTQLLFKMCSLFV